MPATPIPLLRMAATVPKTCVPCGFNGTCHVSPLLRKSLPIQFDPCSPTRTQGISGCVIESPESINATFIDSVGRTNAKCKLYVIWREDVRDCRNSSTYLCCYRLRSFGVFVCCYIRRDRYEEGYYQIKIFGRVPRQALKIHSQQVPEIHTKYSPIIVSAGLVSLKRSGAFGLACKPLISLAAFVDGLIEVNIQICSYLRHNDPIRHSFRMEHI
jgi:hypothetical protein